MLYYSEVLNKTFKTEEELKKQEEEHLAKVKDEENSSRKLKPKTRKFAKQGKP